MIKYLEDIQNHIKEADLVVVGLGEEWNVSPTVQNGQQYQRIIADLSEKPEYRWILPFVYRQLTDESLRKAYKTLFDMLEGKNYYVVATTVNRSFLPFVKENRAVMPCGSDACLCDEMLTGCEDIPGKVVQPEGDALTEAMKSPCEETVNYSEFLHSLTAYIKGEIALKEVAFVRDSTGEVIPFNSIYSPEYKEEGYLPQWSKYMSWLQGTMNRKTCLLELGAGLQFPSVFRFPFEKMAYFNQKAFCFRVHKSLYQLTEEMAERSMSVPVHAVELFSEAE